MVDRFHATGKLRLFTRFGGIELYLCTQAFAKKYDMSRSTGRDVTNIKWQWSNKIVKIVPLDIPSALLTHSLISTDPLCATMIVLQVPH